MELRTVEQKMLLTSDVNDLSDYKSRHEFLSHKIARNVKRMEALKIDMNDNTNNNNK